MDSPLFAGIDDFDIAAAFVPSHVGAYDTMNSASPPPTLDQSAIQLRAFHNSTPTHIYRPANVVPQRDTQAPVAATIVPAVTADAPAVSAVVVREVSARRLKHRHFDQIRIQRQKTAMKRLQALVTTNSRHDRADRVGILIAAADTIAEMNNIISTLREENERNKKRLSELEYVSAMYLSMPPLSPTIAAWMRPYTPGPLTASELSHFYQFGYVIKENFIPPSILQAVMAAIDSQVDSLANALYRTGAIVNTHSDADSLHRLSLIEKEFPSAAVLLHRYGVLDPAFAHLWSSDELMAVAHQLLGPEVGMHPNWNLRCKLPFDEHSSKPWHQDAAYLDADGDCTLQLTASIPLVNTNVRNGCVQVIRGGHRTAQVARHYGCTGDTWYLEMDQKSLSQDLHIDMARDVVNCEVPFGGVIFLNNLLPYRSPTNRTDAIHWSLDTRWQDPAKPSGYKHKPVLHLAGANHRASAEEWWEWSHQDRHAIVANKTELHTELYNTTLCGPWMDRWELVHQNRHTQQWKKIKEEYKSEDETGSLTD